MEHKTCRENLSAYMDGELPPQERQLLENHLAGCRECGGILDELKSVSLIFKTHAVEPVPHSLKEKALGGACGKTAFYPWLKLLLAVSTAAAGVLIVLNVTKSPEPEPAPLPALPKHAAFGPVKARMSAESGLYEGNAPISAASLSGEESEPARTSQAAVRAGAFGQAKAARAGSAGAGFSLSGRMAAESRAVPALTRAAAGGGHVSPLREYILKNYTAYGNKAANRFRASGFEAGFDADKDECGTHDRYVLNDGIYCVFPDNVKQKLYIEKPAEEDRALKPYYDALEKAAKAAGKDFRRGFNINGIWKSDKYGVFVFYDLKRINKKSGELAVADLSGRMDRSLGFINTNRNGTQGPPVKFEKEVSGQGPFTKQLWDVFEYDGTKHLLVAVSYHGRRFFEHYLLEPGKTEFQDEIDYLK